MSIREQHLKNSLKNVHYTEFQNKSFPKTRFESDDF